MNSIIIALSTAQRAFRTWFGASGVLGVSILVALATATTVRAQTAAYVEKANAQGGELEEVIVTAQFRKQSLQETPLAITAVSGESLEQAGYTDITDLTRVAPSVNFTSLGAYGGKTLSAFIRGVGAGDYSFGVEPGVGFYIDDVYLGPSYGTDVNFFDLERAEILRGPQGTLFGKNAIGGAVRLVSVQPKGDNTGYVTLETGSYGLIRVRAAADMAVNSNLAIRLSGYSTNRKGYVEMLDFACVNPTLVGDGTAPYTIKNSQPGATCNRGWLGGEDVHGLKAQARWTPNEAVVVNLSGSLINDNSEGAADTLIGISQPIADVLFNQNVGIPLYGIPYDSRFLPPNHFSTYATFENPTNGLKYPPVNTLTTKDINLNVVWAIDPSLSLTSITAYRSLTNGAWSYDSDSSPMGVDGVYDRQSNRQFSEELRLNGQSLSKRLQWTAGLFYYDAHQTDEANPVEAASFDLFLGTHSKPETQNYAVYLESEFAMTDHLKLILGARESWENKNYLFNVFDLPGTASNYFPGGFVFPAKTDYSHFDWRAGLQQQLTSDFMGYASVSTGFRGGGFNPRPSTPGTAIPYGPETLTNYEIGTRNEFFGKTLRFNNTIFYSDYRNIQLTGILTVHDNPGAGGYPADVLTNAGKAKIYGLESELQSDANGWLSLNAAGSYTHFKYTDLGVAANLADSPTLDSKQVYTPEWKFNAGFDAKLPILENLGKVTLSGTYSWQSKQYSNQKNTEALAIDAYGLLNASLALDTTDGHWRFALLGTNITNKFYYASTATISGDFFFKAVPGRPAEWALTASRKF